VSHWGRLAGIVTGGRSRPYFVDIEDFKLIVNFEKYIFEEHLTTYLYKMVFKFELPRVLGR
jgi:hypothetical protein